MDIYDIYIYIYIFIYINKHPLLKNIMDLFLCNLILSNKYNKN